MREPGTFGEVRSSAKPPMKNIVAKSFKPTISGVWEFFEGIR
jgi:hypothetical protein